MENRRRLKDIAGNWNYERCVKPEDIEWLMEQVETKFRNEHRLDACSELIYNQSMRIGHQLDALNEITRFYPHEDAYHVACEQLDLGDVND